MSRILKFRAWDKERKKMVDVIDFLCMNYPDKYEVMQFTGLKDKNGKEIWEGDVLRFADKLEWYAIYRFTKTKEEIMQMPYATGVVTWNDKDARWDIGVGSISDVGTYLEVIGNIHENPDLLGKDGKKVTR